MAEFSPLGRRQDFRPENRIFRHNFGADAEPSIGLKPRVVQPTRRLQQTKDLPVITGSSNSSSNISQAVQTLRELPGIGRMLNAAEGLANEVVGAGTMAVGAAALVAIFLDDRLNT